MRMRLVMVFAAFAALALPVALSAQATLAAADAAVFLGAWTIGIDTPQGTVSLELSIKDEAGKVAASVTAPPLMPDAQPITDISKEDASLALKYTLDLQGMLVPTKILLVPDGDKWKATLLIADGQFSVDATATKK